MSDWPATRITRLFDIELPILLAPMAGFATPALAVAVAQAGGLGSLPCAAYSNEQARAATAAFRAETDRPLNLNFFCHENPPEHVEPASSWTARLSGYFAELGLDTEVPRRPAVVHSFDSDACELVEQLRPAVVSFHFGLPAPALLHRVQRSGAKIIASATTVDEARALEAAGCDAIIAQGNEAGGHRGMFLPGTDARRQVGTFALVPQVVDAVSVPVIAAGGVSDARGVAAAFALGASAVQIGTAYLYCAEVALPPYYRAALAGARDDSTVLTNVLTGRPARGMINRYVDETGPLADDVPMFPSVISTVAALREKAESSGSIDFSSFWAGQAAALAKPLPAAELTRQLASDALRILRAI